MKVKTRLMLFVKEKPSTTIHTWEPHGVIEAEVNELCVPFLKCILAAVALLSDHITYSFFIQHVPGSSADSHW